MTKTKAKIISSKEYEAARQRFIDAQTKAKRSCEASDLDAMHSAFIEFRKIAQAFELGK